MSTVEVVANPELTSVYAIERAPTQTCSVTHQLSFGLFSNFFPSISRSFSGVRLVPFLLENRPGGR